MIMLHVRTIANGRNVWYVSTNGDLTFCRKKFQSSLPESDNYIQIFIIYVRERLKWSYQQIEVFNFSFVSTEQPVLAEQRYIYQSNWVIITDNFCSNSHVVCRLRLSWWTGWSILTRLSLPTLMPLKVCLQTFGPFCTTSIRILELKFGPETSIT